MLRISVEFPARFIHNYTEKCKNCGQRTLSLGQVNSKGFASFLCTLIHLNSVLIYARTNFSGKKLDEAPSKITNSPFSPFVNSPRNEHLNERLDVIQSFPEKAFLTLSSHRRDQSSSSSANTRAYPLQTFTLAISVPREC